MKFAPLSEADSASGQETASHLSSQSKRYPSRGSSTSSEPDDSSDEQSSYALQERSSVCDDEGDYRSLNRIDTSSTAGVGSTVYKNFLCVFDEQRTLKESQRQVTLIRHQSQETAKRVVSLPQFLWQPGGGLCCQAGDVNFAPENDDFIVFEEPNDGDYELHYDENDYCEPLLYSGRDEISKSGEVDSSFMGSVLTDAGKTEEPKYVPRPSSTNPGLKELSKLLRTSSDPEGSVHKQNLLWEQDKPAIVTPPRVGNEEEKWAHIRSPQNLAKSRSTPPFSLSRFHRRTGSDNSSGTSVISSISQLSGIGSAFKRHNKTASEHQQGSKKTKNSVRNLFRRKKLPSFRKPRKSSGQTSIGGSTMSASEGNVDADTILHSLEATLRTREESSDGRGAPAVASPPSSENKAKVKAFSKKVLKNRSASPHPQNQPLSTQGSGDTHSETSLEELFSSIEHEEAYHEGCDSSCSSDDDTFFSTPYEGYFGSRNNAFIGNSKDSPSSLRNNYKSLRESMEDRNNAILSMHDLSRTSSVDTAKASNLSCDPLGDRARLLDLQASLRQQEEELIKRQNAPPLDFEAGDNVIRVRDAICEIEVLPKRDLGPCPVGEQGTHHISPGGGRKGQLTTAEF